MKAEEARGLSNKKAITNEQIIEGVKSMANNGDRQYNCIGYLSTDIVTNLLLLGYSIKTREDPFSGMKSTIIEW